jgi:hypothetical protein
MAAGSVAPMRWRVASRVVTQTVGHTRDTMGAMKVAVSARLEADLVAFLDGVRTERRLSSRSEALELAIRTLRDAVLEADYAAAMGDWSSAEAALWDAAAADGLEADAAR